MRFTPYAFLLSGLGAIGALPPMISLSEPPAPRRKWKGRRASKYMPHEGKQEVERRRRQREKIEARRAAQL